MPLISGKGGILIDERILDLARERVSIVDVVGDYVDLRKRGSNYFGICPFHEEKTASLAVHPARGTFKCFGCGEGGNIYTFLMKIEGMAFTDAVKKICNRAGIELKQSGKRYDDRYNSIYEANEQASEIWRDILLKSEQGNEALEYLRGDRGLEVDTIENWKLGYAPDEWSIVTDRLLDKGFSEEELISWGLSQRSQSGNKVYDRFRRGITIPINNRTGKIIGFAARTFPYEKGEDFAKFINSPETDFYSKSRILFGMDSAARHIIRERQAVLMEGYFDVIQARKYLRNAICLGGTAFTDEHALQLKRLADEIIICLDSDAAGKEKAIAAGIKCLEHGLEARVVEMPEGFDPDDVIREQESWNYLMDGSFSEERKLVTMVKKAKSIIDFQLDQLKETYHPDAIAREVRKTFPVIKATPSPLLESLYLKHVWQRFDLPKTVLWKEYVKWMHNGKSGKKGGNLEIAALSYLARVPTYRLAISEILTEDDFSTEERKQVFGFFTDDEDLSRIVLQPDHSINDEEGFLQLLAIDKITDAVASHYGNMGVNISTEMVEKTFVEIFGKNSDEITKKGMDYVKALRKRNLEEEIKDCEREAKLLAREGRNSERIRVLADMIDAQKNLEVLARG